MRRQEEGCWRYSDWYLVLGFFILHLGINLFLAGLYPVPWFDEVCLADPGVNLYYGAGYSSTACPEWVGPPRPLYPFALALWLKIWGFTLASVRGFSYVCAVGAVGFVLIGVNRLELVRTTFQRILLVVVCLWAYSIAFAYRAARMEPLIVMIIGACFAASTIRKKSVKTFALFCLGFLLGVSGLQVLVFLISVVVVSFCVLPREFRNTSLLVFVAALVGKVFLAAVSHCFGVDFSQDASSAFLKNSLAGALLAGGFEYTHINNIPKAPDFYLLCLVFLCSLFSRQKRSKKYRFGMFVFFGIVLIFVVFAHLPTYYACFAVLPATVALVSEFSVLSKRLYFFRIFILVLIVFLGLPFQLLVGYFNRDGRHAGRVFENISKGILSTDTVYADYSAYYAVKSICPRSSYFGNYLERISDSERGALDVLIVSPGSASAVMAIVGGRWEKEMTIATAPNIRFGGWSVGAGLLESNYDLALFRRVSGEEEVGLVGSLEGDVPNSVENRRWPERHPTRPLEETD